MCEGIGVRARVKVRYRVASRVKMRFPCQPQSARVYVSTAGADVANTLIVRPWFDTVRELQSQAFATNTPPQRQQLFLGDRRLQDDGRVLALHGLSWACFGGPFESLFC